MGPDREAPSREWLLVIIGAVAFVFFAVTWVLTWQYFCAIPLFASLACLIVGLIPLPAKRRSRAKLVGFVTLFVAFVVALGLIEYEIRPGYPVKILAPDHYQGKFWIVVDKAKGQTPRLVNGVWVFEIPLSGILLINDDSAFTIMHSEDYYFANGQPFKITDDGYGSTYPTEPVGYHWTIVP